MIGLKMMLLALLLIACSSSSLDTFGPMSGTVIRLEKGTVRLKGGRLPVAQVSWTTSGASAKSEMKGRFLNLSAPCTGLLFCSTELMVEGPSSGSFDIELEDGSINMDKVVGDVTIDLEKGDITGTGLAVPNLKITAHWTNIKLRFAKPPSSVKIDVVVGDITIEAPPAHYNFDVDPELQKNLASYDDVPSGIPISVHSTSGQLKFSIVGDGDGVSSPGSFGKQ
jgi:hypothetical protein